MTAANIILAATAAVLWSAVIALPRPATGVETAPQPQPTARYCLADWFDDGATYAMPCRQVWAERGA